MNHDNNNDTFLIKIQEIQKIQENIEKIQRFYSILHSSNCLFDSDYQLFSLYDSQLDKINHSMNDIINSLENQIIDHKEDLSFSKEEKEMIENQYVKNKKENEKISEILQPFFLPILLYSSFFPNST